MFLKAAITVGAIALASMSQASVVWQFTDDGSGGTRMQISGTFDVSGGTNFGLTAAAAPELGTNSSFFPLNLQSQIPSFHDSSLGVTFAQTSGSGVPVNMSFLAQAIPNLSIENVRLQTLGTDGQARVIVFGPTGSIPTTGTFSEDIAVPSIAFSNFNPGVWEYGDPDTPNQGIRLEIGQVAAVPLPASIWLLGGAVAAGAAARRGRKPSGHG